MTANQGPPMTDYVFVYHPWSDTFVLRFRVGSAPEEGDLARLERGDVEEALGSLRRQFPGPEYVVERMSGTSWRAVQENFWGLYRS
jgi:hypothetical protein